MTPSIFSQFNVGTIAGKVNDEWTVAQYVDSNVAKEVLERLVMLLWRQSFIVDCLYSTLLQFDYAISVVLNRWDASRYRDLDTILLGPRTK